MLASLFLCSSSTIRPNTGRLYLTVLEPTSSLSSTATKLSGVYEKLSSGLGLEGVKPCDMLMISWSVIRLNSTVSPYILWLQSRAYMG